MSYQGVKIIRSHELDTNTPQTSGLTRAAAIDHARTGAQKIWAGTVNIHPDAKTGVHHHGEHHADARDDVCRWGDAPQNNRSLALIMTKPCGAAALA